MENNDDDLFPTMLDEHDAAAVVALLIRMVRIDDELKRDRDLIAEANVRVAANGLARGRTLNAFTVFGFETGDGMWDRVMQSIGLDVYNRAIDIAREREVPKLLERMGGDEANPKASESRAGHGDVDARHTPRIRDAILEYLQGLGDAGANVGQVRRHLTDAYGLSVHEKTPGMTLYRLLKDEMVRREGRTWYYAKASSGNNEDGAHGGQTARASDFDDLIAQSEDKEEAYEE